MNLFPYHLLASSEPVIFWFGPQGMLIWAVGPAVIAGVLFYLGNRFNVPVLKYLAIIPLAIGLMVGAKGTIDLNDPIYTSMYDITSKRMMMTYATWIIPLVTGIGLWFMDFRNRRAATSRL